MERYLSSVARMEGVDYGRGKGLIKDFFLEDMTHIRMDHMSILTGRVISLVYSTLLQ